MIGNKRNFRPLVIPAFERSEMGRHKASRTRPRELVALPDVKASTTTPSARCRRSSRSSSASRVGLLSREFSIDTGELSRAERKRRVVEQKYQELIDASTGGA